MEIKDTFTHEVKRRSKSREITVITITSIFAVLCFLTGFLLSKYEITQLILDDRLKMRQSTPHFKWWQDTSDVLITCKVYIFTVTNGQRWLDNEDDLLQFEEIGPIVYRETLEHRDVVFHPENSTISYNSHRELQFMPERNEPGILNRTIIVPNTAVLAMAATLQDSSTFVKFGYRLMLSSSGDSVLTNTTVYNYLWNQTSPVMKSAKKIVPFMVPLDNIGVLAVMYQDYNDRVNVRHGSEHGDDQFFMISTYKDRPTVPGYLPENGDCFASIVNSSEGASYQQNLDEKSVLIYWRRSLCRAVPLYFEKKVYRGPLLGYEYVLPDDSYDRLPNKTEDCYKGQNNLLEDGMTDMSKCLLGFPVAATSPHYYARNLSRADRISGMKPNRKKHGSYIIADPSFGIPLDQCARTQSNLVLPPVTGFSEDIQKFSDMVLPMFWIEYHQGDLPSRVVNLLRVFYIVKDIQPYLAYFFYGLFILLLVVAFRKARHYDSISEEIKSIPLLENSSENGSCCNNNNNNGLETIKK